RDASPNWWVQTIKRARTVSIEILICRRPVIPARRAGSPLPNSLRDQLRDVLILHIGSSRGQAILQHRHTERTRGGHQTAAGPAWGGAGKSLLYLIAPLLVDSLSRLFFHPHQSAAAAATHAG